MDKFELTVEQRNFLRSARVGQLATVDKNGFPAVVPFCFVFHNNAIYSVIDEKPKRQDPQKLARIRNIERNSKVGIVIDEYSEDWKKLRFLQLKGNAVIVSKGADYEDALRQLAKKYSQYRKMKLSGRPLIRITASRLFAWSWQRRGAKSTG